MKDYNDLVELLKRVQATGGLDCDIDSVCEYQDMIGHSSEEQLADLANGKYSRVFYRVYCEAYNVHQTIEFYCKHGKFFRKLQENLADAKADVEKYEVLMNGAKNRADSLEALNKRLTDDLAGMQKKSDADDAMIETLNAEIIQLKAKLYDMMTKEK